MISLLSNLHLVRLNAYYFKKKGMFSKFDRYPICYRLHSHIPHRMASLEAINTILKLLQKFQDTIHANFGSPSGYSSSVKLSLGTFWFDLFGVVSFLNASFTSSFFYSWILSPTFLFQSFWKTFLRFQIPSWKIGIYWVIVGKQRSITKIKI